MIKNRSIKIGSIRRIAWDGNVVTVEIVERDHADPGILILKIIGGELRKFPSYLHRGELLQIHDHRIDEMTV